MELLYSSSSDYLLPVSALIISVLLLYKLFLLQNPKSNFPPEAPGGLPIIGHLHHLIFSRKIMARTLADMAERHGPVFSIRLGVQPVVVVSDSKTAQECFTHQDKALASRPKSSTAEHLTYNYAAFGAAPYGSYWRDTRKLATTHLLSAHRLKSLGHVQVSEIGMLMKELYLRCLPENNGPENRGTGSVVVITELFKQLTYNSITRLIAGKRYFSYRGSDDGEEEGRRIGELMEEFLRFCGELVPSDIVPFLGWMKWLPAGPVKSMKRTAGKIDEVMQSWIEEHKLKRLGNIDKGQSDFIDVMLSQINEDFCQEYSPETVIKATAMGLIIGGADTTYIMMTWILSNLVNNRHVMELAQQEIDTKIGKTRVVESSDIDDLIYLQAVIKETLRLYPAAPLGVAHEAIEDCNFLGYHIPKGTHVVTNLWKIHRDPKVWSDPDEFKPERFLADTGNVGDVNNSSNFGQNNFEFMPFGWGRRSCPGTRFALQVLSLTLARLLQGFSITTPIGVSLDMSEGMGITLPKATPLEVQIAPRLLPQLY